MSVGIRKPMSLEAFLEWEERQELRYEFDGFEPMAMTGGTSAHSAIQVNIAVAVGGRLRGEPCRLFSSDLKIQVAGSIRYPDAFVVCTPVRPNAIVVTEPVVVFEVLSPSTASTDINTKNLEYRDTPSIRRYVMLAQDSRHATVFERVGDDWIGHVLSDDAVLAMPEIGVKCRWLSSMRASPSNRPQPMQHPISRTKSEAARPPREYILRNSVPDS
ncbi:MAG: Uma2 family endonuclease [Rhodopila sp.]